MKKLAVLGLFLALIFVLTTVSAAPALQSASLKPYEGTASTEFVFTVRYVDLNAPGSVNVVIEGTPNAMTEVDPTDTNYSDGKDYFHRTTLPKGVVVYYYKATSGTNTVNTPAYTVPVDVDTLTLEHLDIALAVGFLGLIFLIPFIYLIIIIKRMARDISNFVMEFKEKNEK